MAAQLSMASEYRIHRPYVLAILPRPLDHTDGRIVAREVYGQRDGQKKRKRPELAVGVDGETASIYDVPASRLITSYPIPPQESFTCPPYSVRVRQSDSNDVLRYTFIATKDASCHKITLFKDVVRPDGKTTSTTSSQTLQTSPIRYMTGSSSTSPSSTVGEIVAVCQNGEVVNFSGDSLAIQWLGSSKSAVQDVVAGAIDELEVEYVSSGSLSDSREGIFKNRLEVFSALPRALDSNPSILVLVSRSISKARVSRHLVVLAAMPGNSSTSADLQKLIPLDVSPLGATPGGSDDATTYQVDVQSGLLLELSAGCMSVYDVTGAVPKQKSTAQLDGAESFIRLSRPFVLTTSLESVDLYNYQYRSIHATSALDLSELPCENRGPRPCQLITYLRNQDLVVALIDNVLVSINIEPPKAQGKRRRGGLLIDSIGRGSSLELRSKKLKSKESSVEFSQYVPGTVTESYLAKYREELQAADEMLSSNDLAKWEDFLEQKFGMSARNEGDLVTAATTDGQGTAASQELPEWKWLTETPYPSVDRRWVTYAISQVFSVETTTSDEPRAKLRFVLPDSNVSTYLVVAGHLTLANLRLALRGDLSLETTESKALAGDLMQCLTEADPSMTLLLHYLRATKLGEVELILVIRTLMLSMDLVPKTDKLTGTKPLRKENGGAKEDYEMDLDDLEREIAVTEHHLGDESSSRSRGLTLALTKLWRLPAGPTVKALRETMQTEEILALIYLLRVELVRGGWTSRYVDPTGFESEGNEPPPDGVIGLIADLLGRCLDAMGTGGWLFNDAISGVDKAEAGDFLTALKLEVSAALEGVEQALYLKGLVSEAARFGFAAMKKQASQKERDVKKPIKILLGGHESSRLLPLGLKTKQLPSKEKVVSGGEVVRRSAREIGYLKGRNVPPYSLEKITI